MKGIKACLAIIEKVTQSSLILSDSLLFLLWLPDLVIRNWLELVLIIFSYKKHYSL